MCAPHHSANAHERNRRQQQQKNNDLECLRANSAFWAYSKRHDYEFTLILCDFFFVAAAASINLFEFSHILAANGNSNNNNDANDDNNEKKK